MTASIKRTFGVLVFVSLLPAQEPGERWPFGVEPGARTSAFAKRDLYNLGLLGAKAWDANRAAPKRGGAGGRRSVGGGNSDPRDLGPKRLVVEALLGGGPAQKAGLKLGDQLVGVGKKTFERAKGCFAPLATALLAAESRGGKVTLLVDRGGKRPEKVTCMIPVAGSQAKRPSVGKQRVKILADAVKWLAGAQLETGGFPHTLGGTNGAAVNTSLAGLAWVGSGSSLDGGEYQDNLSRAKDFVVASLTAKDRFGQRAGDANWDQTNWKFAYAAIFLGELAIASEQTGKTLLPQLQGIGDTLTARAEASGGYAHGPGGPNALGYLELNILGGFVLSALSLCKQAGAKVDAKSIAALNEYLEASGGGDGGVGYSTRPGQKGRGNIGRTAVAWLGDVGLGHRKAKWTRKMQGYVDRHIDDILAGHASLMQHITLAGVAATALGAKASKKYWKVMSRDLTLARCPDGSLQARPWHETLGLGSNSDVSMGQVWTTASWAVVLAAQGLPAWTGKRVK